MTRDAKRLEWAAGLVALTAVAVLFSAAASDPAPTQHPNLQGTWNLNEDLTARMRQDDAAQGAPGGGQGGMGRHGGGGGRRRGGASPQATPGSDSGSDSARQAPPSFAALDVLTITQQGDQVTVADKDGNTRILKTDNHKVRDEKAPGGPADLKAGWDKDGILTVEIKPDKGAKRTESYLVSNDGKHLYVTLVIDRNGHDMKIRRAYDSAPPEKAPAGGSGDGEDNDREVVA